MNTPSSLQAREECVFCDIVAGRAGATVVDQNDGAIAFLDLTETALSPGHTLVVPRRHCDSVVESDSASADQVIQLCRQVATAMRRAGVGTGCNMLSANGPGSDQSVFHWHMHVVPRHEGDGIDTWPTHIAPVSPRSHREAAAKIVQARPAR